MGGVKVCAYWRCVHCSTGKTGHHVKVGKLKVGRLQVSLIKARETKYGMSNLSMGSSTVANGYRFEMPTVVQA